MAVHRDFTNSSRNAVLIVTSARQLPPIGVPMRSINTTFALILICSSVVPALAADSGPSTPVAASPAPPVATPPAPAPPAPPVPPASTAPSSTDAPAAPPAPATDAGATVDQPQAPAPSDVPAPPPPVSGTESTTGTDEATAVTPALPVGVHGMLLDESTGVGLPAATITVLGTSKQTVITELDGSFVISLPPGKYALNFFTPLYDAKTATVEVRAGASTELAMSLEPSASSEEVIEVRGKLDTRTESAALAVRRAATVVSDGVSSQEISRTAASNASEAMKRVVSVSILDNKYVALRGLEGRYVTTLLNGIVLPSTEPDRNAVPLDLFPTSLLANLTVYKSYGAELPGQFGGGTLAIDTNSFPTKFEAKVSLATSANTATIGQQGLFSTSRGTAGYFGFDSGNRQLPNVVPTNQAVRGMTDSEMTTIGQSFRNDWAPTEGQV
ncbi:MAG: carboxypeptidase-like regulatory domain-containing protein, partial [Kofleriaceae bacterium]|nr:carboxypeptidase-like regulatory domain-containing protein [Kofleriaceae bacterium]